MGKGIIDIYIYIHLYLVGGLEHFFIFPYIGGIIPTDEVIFLRGVETNHQPDNYAT